MSYDDLEPEKRREWFGWFGEPWNACLTDEGEVDEAMRIPVPTDKTCAWCDEPFKDTDSGKAMPLMGTEVPEILYQHRECLMRTVVGGLDHLAGRCSCHGTSDTLGSLSEGMSVHEEAIAVDEYITRYGIR